MADIDPARPLTEPPAERARAIPRGRMALLFAVMLTTAAGNTAMQSVMPSIGTSLGVDDVWISLAYSWSALLWVVCAPFWARKSDQRGRKAMMALGSERHHRLASALVRFPRPERCAHHPQQRRPAVGQADPDVVHAQRCADRRHHRLHRRIASSGGQHHGEQQRHPSPRDGARALGRRLRQRAGGIDIGHRYQR